MSRRVALVVDDEPLVQNTVVRMLRQSFDEVLTAINPAEADEVLEERSISHLVCDCNLGHGLPLGTELVPGWRALYPSIERVVVFTGADLTKVPPEVDAVVLKPGRKGELLRALLVEA